MIIGVPKEVKEDEYRVGMVPAGVRMLKAHGGRVILERGAGAGCRIPDDEYVSAGAELVDTPEEIYERAEMVIKVKEPQPTEYPLMREGLILYAYLHLAPAPGLADMLLEKGVTCIAYETIQLDNGSLPLLIPMSEVAGRMSIQVGAHFLEKTQGGRGVLLGGVPGVHRGKVTILGAGTVGREAAKIAMGMGAEVYVLDVDQCKLIYLDDVFGSRITTIYSHADNVREAVARSHLVVGAVLIPGAKAPHLVTREMVSGMKPGSVIVDVAIDQGGCVETSHVTSHRNPTYTVDEVIHYGVPNMPGVVARTSTFALTNTTLPYAVKLQDQGFNTAILSDPCLAKGVNIYKGHVTHPQVAEALGREFIPLETLLA